MKCGLWLCFVGCIVASVAVDLPSARPSATVIPEFHVGTPQGNSIEIANTIGHRKTTTAKPKTTTTAKPKTTTTAKPKTTTTAMPQNTTTAKPKTTTTAMPQNTTTAKPKTTTTAKPETTTTAKPETTTTAKPETTTTAKPETTTTAKPETTTTAKPETTTTAKPETTTTAKPETTTTAKPETTTTAKPQTTTTAKPKTTTTAKPPTPTPPTLEVGNYSITNKGTTQLLAQMALQIRLVSAKVNETFIVQPHMTKTSGFCHQADALLNITFTEGFIMFKYFKNSTNDTVFLNNVSFSLSHPFSTPGDYSVSRAVYLFDAKVGHAASCRNESVDMGRGLYLDITQARMQSFNFTENEKFDVSDPCPADMSNYGVAIGVGVFLLVLIIAVVAAYVICKRRRTGGYQTL